MKRLIALLLTLVMMLSLAACGNTITKNQLEKALQETSEELVLQKTEDSDNVYQYTNDSIMEKSVYTVWTTNGSKVERIEIVYSNIDTTIFNSSSSIRELMNDIVNNSQSVPLYRLRAGMCILQVMNLMTLFDSSYKNKSADESLSSMAAVFTAGGAQFGAWTVSADMNKGAETVKITAVVS